MMPRAFTFNPDKLVDPVAMAEPNFAVKEVLQVSQGCYIMSTFASIRLYQLSYELFPLLLNFKQILNFKQKVLKHTSGHKIEIGGPHRTGPKMASDPEADIMKASPSGSKAT